MKEQLLVVVPLKQANPSRWLRYLIEFGRTQFDISFYLNSTSMCDANEVSAKKGRVSVSRVVLQQGELLRAVIQFLQETGLVNSMRALEQESGLTAEPLSVEMYCLRDMALRGQWHKLFKFLSPLEGVQGVDLQTIRLKVCKQEFLEQLRASPPDSKNTFELIEHYKGLVLTLQQLATLGLSDADHRKLSLMLTLPETALQQEFRNWSLPAARLQLADEVMRAVSKVIGFESEEVESGESESDVKKENKGRLVQLTVKGLLYEKCEKILLNDNYHEFGKNSSQSLDLSSLLPKFEDGIAPYKLLEIVCEEDSKNLKNRKGAVLSPLRSLWQMREKGNLISSGLSTEFIDSGNKHIQDRPESNELRESPNGFADEKLVIELNGKGDLDLKADEIPQPVIHNGIQHSIDSKPPIADKKSHTEQQNASRGITMERETEFANPQSLASPQILLRTRDIPSPGCDSSTPKPDRIRSALTLMPDESPIQPIAPSENVPTAVNQEKYTLSLNSHQSRQQKAIVRKLDMDTMGGSNDSSKAKQNVSKLVSVNSIPKAVQWMVGMGRDRWRREGNMEFSNDDLEVNRAETRGEIEIQEDAPPLIEKKTYQLVISDEGNIKSMGIENLPSNSCKFQPPFIQLVGQLKDTQVIRSVCFHPMRPILAVGTNSRCLYLCQYSFTESQPDSDNTLVPFRTFTNYHKGSLYCLEWSPQGSLLASASNDQSIRVLNLPTENMQEAKEWEEPNEIRVHSGTVRALAFLSEELLASGGAGDSLVRIVDLNRPSVVTGSLLHGGQINEVYASSEHELVTASQDALVRVWDIRSCECVWKVNCPSVPTSACSDHMETRIAASSEDGTLQLFDRRNSKCIYSNRIHQKDARSIRFKPATSDTLLTGSYDGEIKLTYPDLGVSHQIAKFPNKIIQCRFSPDANWMVSSSTDKTVKLWEFGNTF